MFVSLRDQSTYSTPSSRQFFSFAAVRFCCYVSVVSDGVVIF
jgi:hypothetical protein